MTPFHLSHNILRSLSADACICVQSFYVMQVLHIRNLPYETTHEELVELAQPFGRLVQSKLNVGPNRNQAFIEFPDQNSAVTMCNYFNGSADPAKVDPWIFFSVEGVRIEILSPKFCQDIGFSGPLGFTSLKRFA